MFNVSLRFGFPDIVYRFFVLNLSIWGMHLRYLGSTVQFCFWQIGTLFVLRFWVLGMAVSDMYRVPSKRVFPGKPYKFFSTIRIYHKNRLATVSTLRFRLLLVVPRVSMRFGLICSATRSPSVMEPYSHGSNIWSSATLECLAQAVQLLENVPSFYDLQIW